MGMIKENAPLHPQTNVKFGLTRIVFPGTHFTYVRDDERMRGNDESSDSRTEGDGLTQDVLYLLIQRYRSYLLLVIPAQTLVSRNPGKQMLLF